MVLLSVVTYKSGYYKKLYYRISGIEAPITEQPDYWAVRGWANSIKKLNLQADVVFFGNSITYGSQFEEYFKHDSLTLVNLGYPGDNIKGMINRLDMVKDCHPKRIFLMAGINGLKDQTISEFETLYSTLVDSLRIQNPQADLLLESILPVNSNMRKNVASNHQIVEANKVIRHIADSNALTFIDLHSLYYEQGELPPRLTVDGIHLKPEAYSAWGEAIRKFIVSK